jgi:hypothetical protein
MASSLRSSPRAASCVRPRRAFGITQLRFGGLRGSLRTCELEPDTLTSSGPRSHLSLEAAVRNGVGDKFRDHERQLAGPLATEFIGEPVTQGLSSDAGRRVVARQA